MQQLASRLFAALARERLLSPRFVRMLDPERPDRAVYGTRCATVLIREANGATHLVERSITASGDWLPPVHHELNCWP